MNITEVNPDYILGYDPSAAREVWDASNYIECSCPKSKREKLFEELLRKKAVNSEFFEGIKITYTPCMHAWITKY